MLNFGNFIPCRNVLPRSKQAKNNDEKRFSLRCPNRTQTDLSSVLCQHELCNVLPVSLRTRGISALI